MKQKHNEESKKTADELASEMGINLDLKKNAPNEEQSAKAESLNSSQEEKTTSDVIMSQEEWNGVKAQLAKAINDFNDLERDFDNFRARSISNIESARLEGIVKAVLAISPALDTFKKAKSMIKDEVALNGIQLVEKSIMSSLEKLGVKKIDAVGKAFDPNFHNAALLQEVKGKKSGIVIDEMESGYTLNDKVIKYSQVIVAK